MTAESNKYNLQFGDILARDKDNKNHNNDDLMSSSRSAAILSYLLKWSKKWRSWSL